MQYLPPKELPTTPAAAHPRLDRPRWGGEQQQRPHTEHAPQRPSRSGLASAPGFRRNQALKREAAPQQGDLALMERWLAEEEHALMLANEKAERWRVQAAAAEIQPPGDRPDVAPSPRGSSRRPSGYSTKLLRP